MKTNKLFTVLSVLSPMVLTSLFAVNVMAGTVKANENDYVPQVQTITLEDGQKIEYMAGPKKVRQLKIEAVKIDPIASQLEMKRSLKKSMTEVNAQLKADTLKRIKRDHEASMASFKAEQEKLKRQPSVVKDANRTIAREQDEEGQTSELEISTISDEKQVPTNVIADNVVTNQDNNAVDEVTSTKINKAVIVDTPKGVETKPIKEISIIVPKIKAVVAEEEVETEVVVAEEEVETEVVVAEEKVETEVVVAEEKVETEVVVAEEKVETEVVVAEEKVETEVVVAEDKVETEVVVAEDLQEMLHDSDDLADGAMNLHEKAHSSKSKERRELVLEKIEAAEEVLEELEDKLKKIAKSDENSAQRDSIKDKLEIVKEELASAKLTLNEKNDLEVKDEESQRISSKVIELDKANCVYRNGPESIVDVLTKFQENMLGQMSQNMQMMQMMMMMNGMSQGPKVHDVIGSDPMMRMMLEMRYGLGTNQNSPYGFGQYNRPAVNVFGNYYSNPLDGYKLPGQRNDFSSYAPMSIDNSQEGFNFAAPVPSFKGNFSQMDAQNSNFRGVSNQGGILPQIGKVPQLETRSLPPM
jgi:hypothetical protein